MLNDRINKMEKQCVTNVLNLIETFKKQADGTYNITTKENVTYPNGYQVSFVRPEAFEQLSCQDWDDITNYFCTYLNSMAHIGVYCGEAEVSFHCISSEKAINTMVEYNQESILDWDKKNNNPDSPMSWFIMNNLFDEKRVIKYEKILKKI